MDAKTIVRKLDQKLAQFANKERAYWSKKYLKSHFEFYGADNEAVVAIAKGFKKENKDIITSDLWKIIDLLWQSGCHEQRALAIKTLKLYPDLLEIKIMPRLEKLLRTSINWDQVDEISVHLVGRVLEKDFKPGEKYLIKWSQNKNFWLRRASLLAQLLLFRKKQGDKKLFFILAEKMLDESKYPKNYFVTPYTEEKMGRFFIRKAIGWVLRELSAKDPQAVASFLNKNERKMSGLTYREGSRNLPKAYKNKLK
ncbi:MAG: DNA alkylation repair protein [Patescibacteria group bacterium]